MKVLTERILSQMKSGLVTVDEEDRIIFANQSAEKILGYKKNRVGRGNVEEGVWQYSL